MSGASTGGRTAAEFEEPLPSWAPGAHIDLMLTNGLRGQYLPASRVEDEKSWRIGVLHLAHILGEPEGDTRPDTDGPRGREPRYLPNRI